MSGGPQYRHGNPQAALRRAEPGCADGAASDPRCILLVVTDWPTKQILRWILAGTGIGTALGLILRTRQTREVEGWASELGTLVGSLDGVRGTRYGHARTHAGATTPDDRRSGLHRHQHDRCGGERSARRVELSGDCRCAARLRECSAQLLRDHRDNGPLRHASSSASANWVVARASNRPRAVEASERGASRERGNHPRRRIARSRSRQPWPTHQTMQ